MSRTNPLIRHHSHMKTTNRRIEAKSHLWFLFKKISQDLFEMSPNECNKIHVSYWESCNVMPLSSILYETNWSKILFRYKPYCINTYHNVSYVPSCIDTYSIANELLVIECLCILVYNIGHFLSVSSKLNTIAVYELTVNWVYNTDYY